MLHDFMSAIVALSVENLPLFTDVLELVYFSEELVRVSSICRKSHVKIRLKYMISPKRKKK